jgi:hypothetical protein
MTPFCRQEIGPGKPGLGRDWNPRRNYSAAALLGL